jgi:hypothetical protein
MPCDVKDIEKAYKKLKASVYYDKTQLALRNKIVMYEKYCAPRFQDIADMLNSSSPQKWNQQKKVMLSTIRALTLPKELKVDTNENVIMNDISEKVVVEKPQYFIDCDAEVQLLGVLWILTIGKILDKEFYEHSYGNRLKKNLLKEGTAETSFSPYLFQPYYEQYESWRDTGLGVAQDILKNKKDAIILTLDFQSFFYSVNSFYEMYLNSHEDEVYIKRINEFVFEVLKEYSSLFSIYDNRDFLPIGFLPSNILSNWYLDKLDHEIIKRWNPAYYGRYVDDIIIVDKIEKNSEIYNIAHKDSNLNSKFIIEYFLCNCQNSRDTLCPNGRGLFVSDTDQNNNQMFKVSNEIFRDKKNKIVVQNKKVKVFYFKNSSSDSLITRFRNDIAKNKSEFRFLPEEETIIEKDDYTEIYTLKNNGTINKLHGVASIAVDKYELSKFLGKYTRIGNLINDKVESKFEKDIEKIFSHYVTIENYNLWEKVFLNLVINNELETLLRFTNDIFEAIKNLTFIDKNENHGHRIVEITDSLFIIFSSGLYKSLAHSWGPHIEKCIDELTKINFPKAKEGTTEFIRELVCEYRANYCLTRMLDRSMMPAMIDAYIDKDGELLIDDGNEMNLADFTCLIKYAINLKYEEINYRYYPYIIAPQDIALGYYLDALKNGYMPSDNDIVHQVNSQYMMLNYMSQSSISNPLSHDIKVFNLKTPQDIKGYAITVGSKKQDQFKIGVANVELKDETLIKAYTDNPVRTYDRYKKMASVVNEAIKNNVDILVLPESYLPFEWIHLLAKTSSRTGMAIITGIEHVKIEDRIYNLTATILPYACDDYRYANISLHSKRHFSPEEERVITGYGMKKMEGKTYTLFNWNDLWFATYCCFELSSITERSLFQSYADMLAIVEWNKDVNYYSNIIESLSRDIHCYCVQVNSRNYGDSRITQPSKTDTKDILKVKGGTNETILVGKIDIRKLREFQIMQYELQKESGAFKPTPPNFDAGVIKRKLKGTLSEDDFFVKI